MKGEVGGEICTNLLFVFHSFPPIKYLQAVNTIKGAVDDRKRTYKAIKQELKHAAHRRDNMVDVGKRTPKAIKQANRTGAVTMEKLPHRKEDMINLAVEAMSDTTEHISQLREHVKIHFRKLDI